MKLSPDFWKSKTTWTGIFAIATALYGGYSKHLTWPQAIGSVYAALQTMFIRDAMVKPKPPVV